MATYTASSADGELVVSVGDSDEPLKVSLSPAAMAAGDEELATRILWLSTLTYLRRQCANRDVDQERRPSEAQVAAIAAILDF